VAIKIVKEYKPSEEELKSVPEGANLGLGCGNPVALASLKEEEKHFSIEYMINDPTAKSIVKNSNIPFEKNRSRKFSRKHKSLRNKAPKVTSFQKTIYPTNPKGRISLTHMLDLKNRSRYTLNSRIKTKI